MLQGNQIGVTPSSDYSLVINDYGGGVTQLEELS